MDISFVIPVFNEEGSVEELYARITEQMRQISKRYEFIFVDDGSIDASFEKLLNIAMNDDHVQVLKFRKNFGKSVALDEGFKHSKGKVIITMDADLQDDPKEILRFISELDKGYDLVSGWKKVRKDPLFGKNLPSKLFNFMIGCFSGLKIHDYNCGFKAYKEDLAKALSLYGDLYRYIPAIAHSMGYKVTEIPIEHHPRMYGKSKYGLDRFTHGLFDFITIIFLTKYLKRPMHLFGSVGFFFSVAGFIICLYLSIIWFMGERIGNRPLLLLGVLLILLGTQFVFAGLVAEMITYNNRQEKTQDTAVDKIVENKTIKSPLLPCDK
jgi:glycosyltransferase involved in cell wall biosynthesis